MEPISFFEFTQIGINYILFSKYDFS